MFGFRTAPKSGQMRVRISDRAYVRNPKDPTWDTKLDRVRYFLLYLKWARLVICPKSEQFCPVNRRCPKSAPYDSQNHFALSEIQTAQIWRSTVYTIHQILAKFLHFRIILE